MSDWTTVVNQAGTTYADSSIAADTQYYFRVTAENGSVNSAASNLINVTTPLAAPAGLATTVASNTEIDLAWTAETHAVTYKVDRSLNGTTWSTLSATVGTNAYSDTGLLSGTTYYYRVSSTDANGTSVPAAAVHATTDPAAPTLSDTNVTATGINFSWTASATASMYLLETSPDNMSDWTTVVNQAGTTYTDTSVAADTAYYFRVTAENGSEHSAASNLINLTTPLAAPAGLAPTVASSTEIDLAWTAETHAVTYKVERSLNGTTAWSTLAAADATNAYSDTGLAAGTTYYYRISSTDANGTSAPAASVHATTNPAAPTLTDTVVSGTQINFSWTPSLSASMYLLQTSPDNMSDFTTVISQAGTTYSDTGLTANTQYYFQVTAENGSQNSVASNLINVTTPLASPAGLAATVASATVINLAWTAETGATTYKVEHSLNGTTWSTVAAADATNSYSDTGLTPGTTYYYRISSTDANGTSAPATAVHAATNPSAPVLTGSVVSATAINLSWNTVASAVSYTIIPSTDGMSFPGPGTTQANATFAVTGLTADTSYYYEVVANNATAGMSAASNIVHLTTLLTAPAGPAAAAASSTSMTITWTTLADATGFKIERSTNQTIWTTLSTGSLISTSTSFTDTGLTAGTLYYYRISGVDAAGTSAPSAVFSGTTLLAAPAGLTATAVSAHQVNVSWTNDIAAGLTGYNLYYSTDGSTFTLYSALTPGTSSLSIGGLTTMTEYYFKLTVTNVGGESAPTAIVHATTM